MSIFIVPYGDLCNKIMSLVGAIDLNKKTNKKIELWYSDQHEDLLYEESFKTILNNFPKLVLNNIDIKFFESSKSDKHISYKKIVKRIDSLYNENNIIKFNLLANEFPLINYNFKKVIMESYIRGYKNQSFKIVKDWLKDIRKYRSYNIFMNDIGYNWLNKNKNLCIIHLQISQYYDSIYNNFNNYHYIHTVKYYEEALKIISKKSKLPLYFIIMTDANIDSLNNYYKKINEFGEIIYLNQNHLNRTNIIILASKAKYVIGSLNHYYSTFLCHIFENIELSVAPNFEILNENNFSKKIYIINDSNYRIKNKREILKNNLFLINDISFDEKLQLYKSNIKNNIKIYSNYYNDFDNLINSKYLKNLLLSRFYYNDSNKDLREVNSNISLDEGIELYKIIKKYKPKKLVEIGFAVGISTLFMLCALENNTELISVDPYQKIQWDKFGLINVDNILEEQNLPKTIHKFIEDYSNNFFTNTNKSFDLVFIDGDHSYEGTMIDLIGANKILKKNGLMIIDDVLHYDVKKALNNFLKKNDNFEKINIDVITMDFYIKKN